MSMRILAIDPGTTTGIVRHELPNDTSSDIWLSSELGPEPHHYDLYKLLELYSPDVVVCEEFNYRIVTLGGTEMPGIVLDSKEYIGVAKLWCQINDKPIMMQSPALSSRTKGLWTDTKLKALGLYQAPGGRQHMNSAMRHILNYIVVTCKRKDYLSGLRPGP